MKQRRNRAWIASAAAALTLAGCVTINDAPVVELSTDPGTPIAPGSAADHVVVGGETLYGIAFRHGLDYRALAVWNSVQPPFVIQPGQLLRLSPPPRAHAAADMQGDASALVEPKLQAGDVQTYALGAAPDPGAVLAVESIEPNTIGTVADDRAGASSAPLAVAADAPVANVPPPTTAATPVTPAQSPSATTPGPLSALVVGSKPAAGAAPRAAGVAPSAPNRTTAGSTAHPLPPGPTRSAGGVTWRWPAQGQVIGRYTSGDPARQGIDVQGTDGAPVVAAGDGEVVYSGNGLVGYGELVIIKHSTEFLSAYGHNRKRMVAEGSKVTAGQQIAEMGKANGTLNVLHFEIRRAGKPVDPLSILPRR